MLYVKSLGEFKTVCASFPIRERMVIYTLSDACVTDKQTRTSIKVGQDRHAEDPVGKYINHSCSPNIRIDSFNIVAIKDIDVDEEILFDYSSEGRLSYEFICNCCGKRIY